MIFSIAPTKGLIMRPLRPCCCFSVRPVDSPAHSHSTAETFLFIHAVAGTK